MCASAAGSFGFAHGGRIKLSGGVRKADCQAFFRLGLGFLLLPDASRAPHKT
jgi:hypothetical protein